MSVLRRNNNLLIHITKSSRQARSSTSTSNVQRDRRLEYWCSEKSTFHGYWCCSFVI